ncbi:MAG TPA: hypothetical protein VK580_01670 [Steroidobacteraceae bacterium]|nr:hypothetical protein [Steroidobacteraceae bacterium]
MICRTTCVAFWTALLLEIERGERKVTPMRSRRSVLLDAELAAL